MTPMFPIDEVLCVRLMMTLAHFLWQGAAVGLAALLAGLLLKRTSASTRYLVLLGALLVMAACPPVTFLLLKGNAQAEVSAAAPQPAAAGQGNVAGHAARRPAWPGLRRSGPWSDEIPQPAVIPAPAADVTSPQIQPVLAPTADCPPAAPTGWRAVLLDRQKWLQCAPYVVAAYAAGVAVTLGRLVLGLFGGGRLRRRSRPVDDPGLLAALGRQARVLGLHVTPAIAYCGRAAVPTVVGVLRPTILLPLAIVSGMTIQQVEVLLAHELAHIRRYDPIVNILQRLIEAFLFFHPAMWLVSRRIRSERELCCDDWVVRAGCTPLAYADSLVRAAELCIIDQRGPLASSRRWLRRIARRSFTAGCCACWT